jgi:hypothetical protein
MRFHIPSHHTPELCGKGGWLYDSMQLSRMHQRAALAHAEVHRLLIGPLGPEKLASSLYRQYSIRWLMPITLSSTRKIIPSYMNCSRLFRG